MSDRELLQMASNALEEFCTYNAMLQPLETRDALRARLTQPEPEPVAVVSGYYGGHCVILPLNPAQIFNANTALYAAPPREWVGLTGEELEFYTEELGQGELGRGVLRAVVDFLKEKNNG